VAASVAGLQHLGEKFGRTGSQALLLAATCALYRYEIIVFTLTTVAPTFAEHGCDGIQGAVALNFSLVVGSGEV
jgi:hypothetical protein